MRSDACCGAITRSAGLGTMVPRGVKWDVPSPAEGWSPASVRHVWWAFSPVPPPCASTYTERNYGSHDGPGVHGEQQPSYPEGAGGTAVGISLCKGSRPLSVLARVLGSLVLSTLLWPTAGAAWAEKGPALALAALPPCLHSERATAGLLPALVLQRLGPRLWHGELGIPFTEPFPCRDGSIPQPLPGMSPVSRLELASTGVGGRAGGWCDT